MSGYRPDLSPPLTEHFLSLYDQMVDVVNDTTRSYQPLSRLQTLGYLEGMAHAATELTSGSPQRHWRTAAAHWSAESVQQRQRIQRAIQREVDLGNG